MQMAVKRNQVLYVIETDDCQSHPSYPTLCSPSENPDDDPYRGGEAEDPGGPTGQPRRPAGLSRAVSPHSVFHQRALCQTPALGLQDGLRGN